MEVPKEMVGSGVLMGVEITDAMRVLVDEARGCVSAALSLPGHPWCDSDDARRWLMRYEELAAVAVGSPAGPAASDWDGDPQFECPTCHDRAGVDLDAIGHMLASVGVNDSRPVVERVRDLAEKVKSASPVGPGPEDEPIAMKREALRDLVAARLFRQKHRSSFRDASPARQALYRRKADAVMPLFDRHAPAVSPVERTGDETTAGQVEAVRRYAQDVLGLPLAARWVELMREKDHAYSLDSPVERTEGDEAAALDSLCGELATILGPGKPPSGVGRVEYWIARVGQALGERETETARLREAIRGELTHRGVYDVLGQIATTIGAIARTERDPQLADVGSRLDRVREEFRGRMEAATALPPVGGSSESEADDE